MVAIFTGPRQPVLKIVDLVYGAMNTQAKALDLVVPDSGFAFMPQGPSTVSFVSNYTSFYRLQTVHETG